MISVLICKLRIFLHANKILIVWLFKKYAWRRSMAWLVMWKVSTETLVMIVLCNIIVWIPVANGDLSWIVPECIHSEQRCIFVWKTDTFLLWENSVWSFPHTWGLERSKSSNMEISKIDRDASQITNWVESANFRKRLKLNLRQTFSIKPINVNCCLIYCVNWNW